MRAKVHASLRTPIHPGEHLAEELKDPGIPAAELARQIEVPVNRMACFCRDHALRS
jgi:plasmid maintenance system antidote protein VapI